MNLDISLNRRALLRAGLGLAAATATPSLFANALRKGFFVSHDLPIGIQLYMLGDDAIKDIETTLARVAAIGYRTIELPGLQKGTATRIRAAADKAGVSIAAVHVGADPAKAQGKWSLVDDSAQLAADLRILNCSDLVLPFPLLPEVKPQAGEDVMAALRRAFRTSTDHWKRTATLLNERGAALQREGLSLSYHNHDVEFLAIGDTSGWEVLATETDPKLVSFELDVAWVVAGGLDPVTLLDGLAGRVRQVHVKDLHAPAQPHEALKMDSIEVGAGIIDWQKLLPTAYRAGARQFFVEQEPPFKLDRFEAASRSYSYLSRL
jgi:sugar phosphate isomerase/epimerase